MPVCVSCQDEQVYRSICHSHIPHVALDGERETASYLRIFRVRVWILQRAAGEYCLLSVIESDGTELLPVRHERRLSDDLMKCDIALEKPLAYSDVIQTDNAYVS